MENIKTKYQCFCRNQNCRRVFNSRSQQLRQEKQCSNPKKEMIETFRKVSNNTYECKKYSKQITHHYNLKHREVPVLLAHFTIKYFFMGLTWNDIKKLTIKYLFKTQYALSHIIVRIIFKNMDKSVKILIFQSIKVLINVKILYQVLLEKVAFTQIEMRQLVMIQWIIQRALQVYQKTRIMELC